MPSAIEQRLILDAARSVEGLLTLLHEGLSWPLPSHLDTIPLIDWEPEELHLRAEEIGRLTAIQQVPRLTTSQPFGVFILTFEGGRLPIGALRRVVNRLVVKKRASRNPDSAQWDLGDLLFFCHSTAGRGSLHIVALRDNGATPQIRTISWTTQPTPTRMQLLSQHALPDLIWPDRTVAVDLWRDTWRAAFTGTYRQGVKTADQLSQRMAEVAQDIRDEITDLLLVETESGPLHRLLADMRERLDATMDGAKFADMFAQTLVYGLLTSRISHPEQFDAAEGKALLDFENPFLDAMYQQFRTQADDSLDLDQLGLTDLAHTLAATDMDALLADFGTKERKDDPVIYLYEEFLDRYDRDQRKALGAYYTPIPVVSAMVRLVDDALREFVGLPSGVTDMTTWGQWAEQNADRHIPNDADPNAPLVRMVDPATGTGTFLLEWIRRAEATKGCDLAEHLDRISALELSLASYSVAHLKTSLELPKGLRATHRLPIFLADTLAGPRPAHLPGTEDPLALESEHADAIKFATPHTVVIGNPPYLRTESATGGALGGMIRLAEDGTPGLIRDFTAPLTTLGAGLHAKNLYNLYVYFWRWAIWKTCEQHNGPGIIAFITASSYLAGKGFAGMRTVLRESFDRIWIIDLGGEGRGARRDENVFDGVMTPVCIAIALRESGPHPDVPASAHYLKVTGTRAEKLAALGRLGLTNGDWGTLDPGWSAPLVSGAGTSYASLPLLTELLPWQHSGAQFKRTWPIGQARDLLSLRWARLRAMPVSQRPDAFRETRDRKTASGYPALHGQVDLTPVSAITPASEPEATARYAFRSFDRQWCLADGRLGDYLRPPLWASISPRQVFMTSLLTGQVGAGPGATATAHVPDLHHFRGSYGAKDVIPLYRDATGTPNSDLAARAVIGAAHRGVEPKAPNPSHEDLFAYCYGVLAGTDYTDRFHNELATPGPRVPLTTDPNLFAEMAAHGRHLVWLHTFGERFRDDRRTDLAVDPSIRWDPEPGSIPQDIKDYRYDQSDQQLLVANGVLQGVAPEVWDFQVSGMPVLKKWLGYRTAKGTGKAASSKSPLDQIRPDRWYPEWSNELREVVHVLTESLTLMVQGAELLTRILEGPLITADQLPEPPKHLREVPKAPSPAAAEGMLAL